LTHHTTWWHKVVGRILGFGAYCVVGPGISAAEIAPGALKIPTQQTVAAIGGMRLCFGWSSEIAAR
jgi:hypothetical protein